MTEIDKIKKSLDIVFDYVNNQNNGVVQTKAINELEYAIKKVENLSICSVTGSISLSDITQAFLDWLESDDVWINDENGNKLPNAEIDGGNFEKYAKKYYQ